jgi:lipoate-protein ligase B
MLYLDLGLTDYQIAWELQKRIVQSKTRGLTQDFLILVEHPPTITLGLRAKRADVILPVSQITERGIAVVEVDRGGGVTYHGPGQLVCYPIMDLRALRLSVRDYVRKLEGLIEGSLVSLGVQPMKFVGRPGIWADSERKIASIGIRIVSRITYHGFSINIDLKDTPGDLIVPCGIPHTVMTDLRQLKGKRVDIDSMRSILLEHFGRVFGVHLEPITLEQFKDLAANHGQ